MSVDEALPVARAFSHFLTLANIAEQHHRIRRRRVYQRDPQAPPQIGSCDETFGRLIARRHPPRRAARCGRRAAHRAGVHGAPHRGHPPDADAEVQAHRGPARRCATGRPDAARARRTARRAAHRDCGGVGDQRGAARRPSPVDEARSGLVVFEQTLWDAVPRFLRVLDAALVKHTGRGLPLDAAPLRFGSWIGGDRDGNPSVTARGHRHGLPADALAGGEPVPSRDGRAALELSMTDWQRRAARAGRRGRRAVPCAAARRARAVVGDAAGDRRIGSAAYARSRRVPLSSSMRQDIAEPLRAVPPARSSETGDSVHGRAGGCCDLQRRVAAFGVTLVRLDVRQDAARHDGGADGDHARAGAGRVLRTGPRPTARRSCCRSCRGRRPLIPADLAASPEVREVLETFRTAATAAAGVARRLRDLDGARRRRTC